jgi:hypothetical protein
MNRVEMIFQDTTFNAKINYFKIEGIKTILKTIDSSAICVMLLNKFHHVRSAYDFKIIIEYSILFHFIANFM